MDRIQASIYLGCLYPYDIDNTHDNKTISDSRDREMVKGIGKFLHFELDQESMPNFKKIDIDAEHTSINHKSPLHFV